MSDTVPTIQREMNLVKICQEFLTLILHLRSTDNYGEESILRSKIQSILYKLENDAKNNSYHIDFIEYVKFALVAFLDETIISSNWREKDKWRANPMQFTLYQRYDAGEEFFKKLDFLKSDIRTYNEVVQVYYMCMTLGFKGQYQLHDPEKLKSLIQEVYTLLSLNSSMSSTQITPRVYPKEEILEMVSKELPAWVIGAVAVGLALIIYVVFVVISNNGANRITEHLQGLL